MEMELTGIPVNHSQSVLFAIALIHNRSYSQSQLFIIAAIHNHSCHNPQPDPQTSYIGR